MKLQLRIPKKKKLQASTAAARRPREADYTEEPNVKLSSAFIVVLVLHVVAVGGIYAFNAIKARQPVAPEEAEAPPARRQAPAMPVANTQMADSPAAESAAVAAPAATAAPTHTYRVRSGDTIAKIANANGVAPLDIITMNNLRELGGIKVGQELHIPGAAPAEQPAPRIAAPHESGVVYTVVRGDTPKSIARKFHVTSDELIKLNKIEDPTKLKIGMKLKVPAKHNSAT